MPLANLFQKRRSQKEKKTNTTSKEIESNGSGKIEPICSTNLVSEVSEVLQEIINKTVEMEENKEIENSTTSTSSGVPNLEEIDQSDLYVVHDVSDNEEIEPSSKQKTKKFAKKKRSVSESRFEVSTEIKQSGRRKFGSVSDVLPVKEKIIQIRQQHELDIAIEHYVDKLIRDSIMKAVKNVNVDSLYHDIVKDFSNRKDSESTESVEDFVVEQRLSSHSVSELVELQDDSDEVSEENDEFHASFVGYLADYEDATSVDDMKSVGGDSSYCSMSNGLEQHIVSNIDSEISLEDTVQQNKIAQKPDTECITEVKVISNLESENNSVSTVSLEVGLEQRPPTEIVCNEQQFTKSEKNVDEQKVCVKIPNENEQEPVLADHTTKQEQNFELVESSNDVVHKDFSDNTSDEKQKHSAESSYDQEQNDPSDGICESPEKRTNSQEKDLSSTESVSEHEQTILSAGIGESPDLIIMSPEDECSLPVNDHKSNESENPPPDFENLPQQQNSGEEGMKVSWKVGYLHVKLPHKSRSKAHLKAWKKRCVAIQPDEFLNDPKNPSLVVSVYGAESRKHKATFWQTVSSQKAVVYRCSSRSHPYAFTISDEGRAIIHLSAESETTTQEWMAAIRAVLWPPSPFMQLEKMLNGREFEISLVDNDFAYHAGLLGMYGYLTITPRKLILLHPQQGYVIQEWYLNTVDKFQLVPQPKVEDAHKVLAMTTCSDSSTGKGEMLLFCNEAVTLLQSLASTIHQVLSNRSKQDGGKYQKEMEEMAEWLVSPTQDSLKVDVNAEEHYKVPPRQVKSLLDIPNFIFEKSLSPVASAIYPAPPNEEILASLEATRSKPTTVSQDSGFSTCNSGEDFLNCSLTSFVIGGGPLTGKSSDSELSDTYTPPRTPELSKKIQGEKKSMESSVPKSTLSVPKA